MGATAWITRLVAEMPDNFVFTTRILIGLGTRGAVDMCLQRLMKKGAICRLARGVFSKGETPRRLSAAEMASIKASAFEKEIVEHPSITAQSERLIPEAKEQHVFATNSSSSSSFRYGNKRIYLKAISAKRRHLRDHDASKILHALWHCKSTKGKVDVRNEAAKRPWATLRQKETGTMASRIPHWLLDLFPQAPLFVYENSRSVINPRADYYAPVYLGLSGMGPPGPSSDPDGRHDWFEPHPGHDRWDDITDCGQSFAN